MITASRPSKGRILPLLVSLCLGALFSSFVSGCGRQDRAATDPSTAKRAADSEQNTPKAAQQAEVRADDPEAVEQLKAAGFLFVTGSDGNVSEFSIASQTDISDAFIHLAGIPNASSAIFTGPGITEKGMEHLAQLTGLRRLDLSDSAITPDVLKMVGELKNLEVLRLRRTGVTDESLAHLAGLSRLRALDLRNTNISDEGMQHIAKLKSLSDLQLEKSKVNDPGIAMLAGLPLTSFNVNYCTTVSNASLEVLGKITTLRSIQLDATKITDDGMVHLAGLKNLTRLRIRDTDITGVGFAHIAGLTNLERLELRGTSIDDDAVAVIGKWPKINYLDIAECRLVSAEGMKPIGNLTGLTYLGFWETKLDDNAMAAFDRLTGLTELDLKATQITDEAVSTILKFQKLKRLNVAGTQLTDEGFRQFATLPNLSYINVANTNIGYDVVDELTAANGGMEVVEFGE